MNKMKYELAKKLKEAGFPQDGLLYSPTLSELIEACEESKAGNKCGDEFYLVHEDEIWNCGYHYWDIYEQTYDGFPTVNGSTPEEAVANLYLELNKNANR